MTSTSKSTTTGFIIYRHSTRANLHHLTKTLRGSFKHQGNTRKPWTHLPSSFPWLIPETKRWNLRFTQCSHFVQLHQEQKEELIYWLDKPNRCFNRPWCFYLNEITDSMELFKNNFFFWWSSHFSTFEPPNNNPPKKCIQFHQPHTLYPTPWNKSRRNMNPTLSN